ncbi:hypothetical protein PR048_014138 [Dryococelus australis]|uniref:Uncharacterized protein n=1 Tax=Dryococelus australis TaxID=614101 RepID=A0ABQ9HDS8_9NEOP|nr:hypothetical protein PR048_014138 [Dryococelus australis]
MSGKDLRRNTKHLRPSYRQSEAQIPNRAVKLYETCHEDYGVTRDSRSPDFKGSDNEKFTGYIGDHVERNFDSWHIQ